MITLAERKKIAEWVLQTEDEALLDKVRLITISKSDALKNFISNYNQEIEEALERVRSGQFKTQKDVDAFLETWESK